MGQVRINELGRELEIKSKYILEYLPQAGVTEKKTHSSSIDDEVADKVRAHFRAEQKAEEEAARREEEAKAAAERAAAEKAAEERAAAERAAAERVAAEKAAAAAPARPAGPGPVPAQPLRPAAAPAGQAPAGVRPMARPQVPADARRAVGSRPAASTGAALPRTSLPGPSDGSPAPVPGKPIYQRRPPARARPAGRPHLEKRVEEGERRFMHPVRTRAKAERGERRPATVREPAAPRREPFELTITEGVTVKELAEKLEVRAKDVIKVLLDRGMLATINQSLDSALAVEVAQKFNGTANVISFEDQAAEDLVQQEAGGEKAPRAPVVTVMGHVDHGKTSLLDAIRETDTLAGEAGGITQHIGAYKVAVAGRTIVFIDTPGHAAFTRMRARGAKVTDLVILVVAADDGVMPQTLEAIDHARAANVPILVAVNKIDKPDATPDRVKKQLADRGLMPEDWGGDAVMVDVSAKEKTNINQLLEMILLVSDMRELRATPALLARGVVLEAKLDRGRGPVATVLVQDGTLRSGDAFIVGSVFGKVRAMFDDHGRAMKEAGPATPVEVLGLNALPEAGDQFQAVTDEVKAKQVANYREQKTRDAALAANARLTLGHLHEQLEAGTAKDLPLILKADVHGSVEALTDQLERLTSEQVKVKIVHSAVGGISETDVLLASASNAVIIGFNVRPERKATDLAQQESVEIRLHTVIYEVLDEIRSAAAGLLEPTTKETILGRLEVRDTFRIPRVGMVAGCYVQEGKVARDASVRVVRDSVVIYQSKINSLRRFKDDVKEVQSGYECGATVSNFSDVKVGDILEVFAVETVASTATGTLYEPVGRAGQA